MDSDTHSDIKQAYLSCRLSGTAKAEVMALFQKANGDCKQDRQYILLVASTGLFASFGQLYLCFGIVRFLGRIFPGGPPSPLVWPRFAGAHFS